MFPHALNPEALLELLEPRHAEELFAVVDRNRSHLRTWLPWVDGTKSAADIARFIEDTQRRHAAKDGFNAVIRFRGAAVGVIGLHHIDWANHSTSIGYWLAAEAQGHGLVTQACRALLDHLFGSLQLNRVVIRCATGNSRSRAIPERLGFRAEGIAREAEWLYDHFVDLVVYALLAAEWLPAKGAR